MNVKFVAYFMKNVILNAVLFIIVFKNNMVWLLLQPPATQTLVSVNKNLLQLRIDWIGEPYNVLPFINYVYLTKIIYAFHYEANT